MAVLPAIFLVNRTSVLIDRTAGTNIGNLTSVGGLAAAFDGNTSQAAGGGSPSACWLNAGSGGTSGGFVGKQLASSKIIDYFIAYPTSDFGFCGDTTITNLTMAIYGKNSAPASKTDGTIIGSIAFGSDQTTPITITSTDRVNSWAYVWLSFSKTGSADGGTGVSELQMYELV